MLAARSPNFSAALSAACVTATSCRLRHDRSGVPRVADDREKRMHKVTDAGYVFRYHRQGVDPLPRNPDEKVPLARPDCKARNAWSESQARFGENDYIDLLGDGNLYKEKMQRNSPRRWHELCKRINFLMTYHNYNKQDELHDERNLGLWEEEPDYYYKDKSRRSFKDLA
ncbi:hypothetical protein QR680_008706 [Steinernema hermaphroditum]|uniref:Large ribosomal subunit protein mL51 n=1 Tax=Steinernema hermaphroditum TaxID=289476 RepID=A0AA39IJJ3_9BILA|nr:hypothetical protein QR680_008706 [Steinernema hermaphroditum]